MIASQFDIMNKPFDNTIWATVSWNIGAAVWPLIFVPLTESKGRMPGYVLYTLIEHEGTPCGLELTLLAFQIFRSLHHLCALPLRISLCAELRYPGRHPLRMPKP